MLKKNNHEPKLCSDCPLRPYLSKVKPASWTNQPNKTTDLKLCMRLRALASSDPHLPKCPHFPESEDIGIFSGFAPVVVKRRQNQQTTLGGL